MNILFYNNNINHQFSFCLKVSTNAHDWLGRVRYLGGEDFEAALLWNNRMLEVEVESVVVSRHQLYSGTELETPKRREMLTGFKKTSKTMRRMRSECQRVHKINHVILLVWRPGVSSPCPLQPQTDQWWEGVGQVLTACHSLGLSDRLGWRLACVEEQGLSCSPNPHTACMLISLLGKAALTYKDTAIFF